MAEPDVYHQVNTALVDLVEPIGDTGFCVDVGCGTGYVSGLIARRHPSAVIVGIDPDPKLLVEARTRLGSAVRLLTGGAQDVDRLVPAAQADVMLYGNCVHLVPDLDAAFAAAAKALRPGGRLALNSAFLKGSEAAADLPRYAALVREARRQARALGEERYPRQRAMAKRGLALEDLRHAVNQAGLTETAIDSVTMKLDAEYIRFLAGTPVFAEGVLPGYPSDVAGAAVGRACGLLLDKMPTMTISRTWFFLVATKAGQ